MPTVHSVYFLLSGCRSLVTVLVFGLILGRWRLWATVIYVAWASHTDSAQAEKRNGPPNSAPASSPKKPVVGYAPSAAARRKAQKRVNSA